MKLLECLMQLLQEKPKINRKQLIFYAVAAIILIVAAIVLMRELVIPFLIIPILGIFGFEVQRKRAGRYVSDETKAKETKANELIREGAALLEEVKLEKKASTIKNKKTDEQIEALEKRTKKRRSGQGIIVLALIIVLLLLSGNTMAGIGLYIPTDYNELKALYIQADQEITEYQEIIIPSLKKQRTDAEAQRDKAIKAADVLQKTINYLQDINAEKDDIIKKQGVKIDKLTNQWGLSPGWESSQGYGLGIERRMNEFGSWGLGAYGSGEIYGRITIWM